MRRVLRDVLAEARRQGAVVVDVAEGGRHTEVTIEVDGRRAVLRLHRGAKVHSHAAGALRSAIREAARQRPLPDLPGGVA